jgi:hypothetical protein
VAVIRLIFVEAVARRGRGEGSKRAHSRSLDFSLRALAAGKSLQMRSFQRCHAAVKPAIDEGCSKDWRPNSQVADKATVHGHPLDALVEAERRIEARIVSRLG